MDPGEAVDVLGDVVQHRLGVPDVPEVELQPERRRVARVADQLERFRDRRHDRPVRAAVSLVGLERDPQPERLGLGAERPQPVDDDPARLVRIAARRPSR